MKLIRLFAVLLIIWGCSNTHSIPVATGPQSGPEACAAHNGEWIPFKSLYPNRELNADDSKRFVCNVRTNDAGMECKDRTDCQGSCVAPAGSTPGSTVVGSCSTHVLLVDGAQTVSGGSVTFPLFSMELTDRKEALLDELHRNKAKWESHKISSYRITFSDETCFCLFGPYYGPIEVLVKDGKLRRATYLGEPRDGYTSGDLVHIDTRLRQTVDELFQEMELKISRTTDNTMIRVEYDSTFGFPRLFEVDRPDWADDQSRLVAKNFKPRPRRHTKEHREPDPGD